MITITSNLEAVEIAENLTNVFKKEGYKVDIKVFVDFIEAWEKDPFSLEEHIIDLKIKGKTYKGKTYLVCLPINWNKGNNNLPQEYFDGSEETIEGNLILGDHEDIFIKNGTYFDDKIIWNEQENMQTSYFLPENTKCITVNEFMVIKIPN